MTTRLCKHSQETMIPHRIRIKAIQDLADRVKRIKEESRLAGKVTIAVPCVRRRNENKIDNAFYCYGFAYLPGLPRIVCASQAESFIKTK
jgi:hypothetical protein